VYECWWLWLNKCLFQQWADCCCDIDIWREKFISKLSYQRCFIWLKSACHVYYSFLLQAIHGRVTSEVNIAQMQMVAIFSLGSTVQKFGWWMTLLVCIHVSNNSCCVIKFALFINSGIRSSQLSVYSLFRTCTVSF